MKNDVMDEEKGVILTAGEICSLIAASHSVIVEYDGDDDRSQVSELETAVPKLIKALDAGDLKTRIIMNIVNLSQSDL